MAHRKKPLGKMLINVATLGISLFNITRKLSRIFGFEAHAALDNMLALIMLAVAAGIVLTTIWLSLLAILFIDLLALHLSATLALCIIILINLFFLLLCALLMRRKKKKIFF